MVNIPKSGDENYKKFMAKLILANNHDLVIEVGNIIGEAEVFKYSKDEGWDGKYITINTSQTQKFNLIHKVNPLFLGGDGLNNKLINKIFDEIKPNNPVYIVNNAVGIILTYRADNWVGEDIIKIKQKKGKSPDEKLEEIHKLIEKMADLWAKNISKTNLKTLYLTEEVLEVTTRTEFNPAQQGGVINKVFKMFKEKWKKKGWDVIEKDIDYYKLLIITR
jgi:hypothetical protein